MKHSHYEAQHYEAQSLQLLTYCNYTENAIILHKQYCGILKLVVVLNMSIACRRYTSQPYYLLNDF